MNRAKSNSNKRTKSSRKGGNKTISVSPDALRYTGPVVPKSARAQNSTYCVVLSYITDVASSGGGVIASSYGLSNPSSCSNWSSFAGAFDEYRVLATEVEFRPNNKYSKVSTTCVPGVVVTDRDSSTVLGSYGSAEGYESQTPIDLEDNWTQTYKMNGARESAFITTASPTNLGAFLTYFSGLSLSTTYGKVTQRFLVQFRAAV